MRAWLVLVAGCGRIGFDDGGDGDAGDAGPMAPCTEPWSAPRPVQLGATANRYGPSVTADELELYFSESGELWVMRRARADAPFGAPVVLLSPPNTPEVDAAPSISADGLDLYFLHNFMGNSFIERSHRASRTAPFEANTATGAYGDGDITDDQLELYAMDFQAPIWVQTRGSTTELFGPQVDLPAVINDGSLNTSPSISSDGTELYFASDRSGPNRLHVARRASKLDPFVEVEAIEAGAFPREPEISADGRHLYFVDASTGTNILSVMSRCD